MEKHSPVRSPPLPGSRTEPEKIFSETSQYSREKIPNAPTRATPEKFPHVLREVVSVGELQASLKKQVRMFSLSLSFPKIP